MAQTSSPCRGCGVAIPRENVTAPIRHYCTAACRPRCAVVGCEKPQHAKGFCSAHATRLKRCGDPLAPRKRATHAGLLCEVEGCGQPRRKVTFCAAHYAQRSASGTAAPFVWKWGDGGYVPSHRRLARVLGRAAERTCVDCGGTAAHWSYEHNDPAERLDGRGSPYSRKPECYAPRCAKCHRRFDRRHRQSVMAAI